VLYGLHNLQGLQIESDLYVHFFCNYSSDWHVVHGLHMVSVKPSSQPPDLVDPLGHLMQGLQILLLSPVQPELCIFPLEHCVQPVQTLSLESWLPVQPPIWNASPSLHRKHGSQFESWLPHR